MTVGDLKRYLESLSDDDMVTVIDGKTMYEATVKRFPTLPNRIVIVRATPKREENE